jgi:hypothetical protein
VPKGPLLAALLVAFFASASPLVAVEVTSPEFEAFAAELSDLVPVDQRSTLAGATDPDGIEDQYHPSGEEPGITPPEADIVLGASFGLETTDLVSCDANGAVCSAARAGLPVGTSFHVYAGTMRAPLMPGTGKRVEFGVVAFDETPADGRPAAAWEAIPEFRGDYFQGSNVAWTMVSENGEPFRLFRLEYGPGDAGFLTANTDAIAIIRGSAWAILVPAAEWEGTLTSRFYVFRANGGDTSPGTSAVDTYPDIFEPAQPSAGRPTMRVVGILAEGSSTKWLIGLGGVVLLLAVGGWLVLRRLGRPG